MHESKLPPSAHRHGQEQKKLMAQSSLLISQSDSPFSLAGHLLASPDSKRRRQKLQSAALQEAAQMQAASLKASTDNVSLMIDVAKQIKQDEMRISHRHAMEEIESAAKSQLNDSLMNLFVTKKRELSALEALEGDQELKQLAASYLSEITTASAQQLIDRNCKPR